MADEKVFKEAPSKEERQKELLEAHKAKLAQIVESPTQSTLLSESELTLEDVMQALGLTSVKEIQLPGVGDGYGGNLVRKVVQTNNSNVYIRNSVREKMPSLGNSEILYFGNESSGLGRFQANFAESEK